MAYGDLPREQMLERPLPHSAEAERAILGAVLLDNMLISQAIEQLKPDDFYVPSNRRIFVAMSALFERGSEIDPLLLAEELRRDGSLDSVGGVTAISNLTYGLPHFANVHEYSKLVSQKAQMRGLVRAANSIISEVLDEADPPEVIIDHAEQAIFAIADQRKREGFIHIEGVANMVLENVQAMSGRNVMLTGLTTGFNELDQMTSGLQPSDLIIIAARPSMGKCLAHDSEIVLQDGSIATIEAIYHTQNAKLLTLADDWKFKTATPGNYIDDGHKPVFRVTTRLGRVIETTLPHPFLTVNGWRPLSELQAGDRVAVPRALKVFGTEAMRSCEVKLLAYLLGDGGLTNATPIFTVGKPALREDFEQAVSEFGGVQAVPCAYANRTFGLRVRGVLGQGHRNPLTEWLKDLGVYGCRSQEKFIPAPVFRLPKTLLAAFLNRLFATDGWASVLSSGQAQLGFASTSEKMARQVQHLLLRFGVIAALKKRAVKYREERRVAWQLDITDALSIKTFLDEIGIHGKAEAVAAVRALLANRRYQSNRDLLPREIWPRIAAAKGAQSWANVARRMGLKESNTNLHAGRRSPTRPRLLALALALESLPLQQLAESEVYWDEIVSIASVGVKQVYDLTIPDTHNFVANDICVHNTALCLSMAQNSAIYAQAVVAIFSLEMSKESLVMRMLSSEARVDAHRFRSGYLSKDEWARLAQALGTLSEARIFIDDTPGINILEMRAKLRRLATEQKKLDMVIVDYLQLMSGSRRTESRQQEVSSISRELKAIAKEFRVPVIALSQLSRASETRTDHKPILSDLRESGSIEQDADVVGFIYREEQYNRTEENAGLAEFIIAKQRNGPTGVVKMAFLKEFTRFENLWTE